MKLLSCFSFCHDRPDTFPIAGRDSDDIGQVRNSTIPNSSLHSRRSLNGRRRSSQRQSEHIELRKIGIPWTSPIHMTAEDLARKRKEFWETAHAFGGSEATWHAIKAAIEVGHDDIELARTILSCAGVITINGLLTEVYDERGFRYNIPPYCLCNPVSMGSERQHGSSSGQAAISKVRIRMHDGATFEVIVDGVDDVTIAKIKDLVSIQTKIDYHRLLIFYQGKGPLKDDMKIEDTGYNEEYVLQVWTNP